MKYLILLILTFACCHNKINIQSLEVYRTFGKGELYSELDKENLFVFRNKQYLKVRTYYFQNSVLIKKIRLAPMGYDVETDTSMFNVNDVFLTRLKNKATFILDGNTIQSDVGNMSVIERADGETICSVGTIAEIDSSVRKEYIIILK